MDKGFTPEEESIPVYWRSEYRYLRISVSLYITDYFLDNLWKQYEASTIYCYWKCYF